MIIMESHEPLLCLSVDQTEHLIPLHVCYGVAGRAADMTDSVVVLNKQAGIFGWFNPA